MTKRKLDEQEIEFTNKGILRIENELEDLGEQLNFNKLTMDFQKAQAEYQKATKPFLMKKKEQEDEKVIGAVKERLARNNATLENLKDQLLNGVTIKTIKPIKQITEVKDGN